MVMNELLPVGPEDWPLVTQTRFSIRGTANPNPAVTWYGAKAHGAIARLNYAASLIVDEIVPAGAKPGIRVRRGVGPDEGKFALEPCEYERMHSWALTKPTTRGTYLFACASMARELGLGNGSSQLDRVGNLLVGAVSGKDVPEIYRYRGARVKTVKKKGGKA
jgi:hypothetical protein